MTASTETLSYRVEVVGTQKAVSDLGAVDASLHKFQQSGVASAAAARQMADNSDYASTHLSKLTDNLFAASTVRPINAKAVSELAEYANLSEASVRRLAEGMRRVEREKAFRQLADDAGLSHMQLGRLRGAMGDIEGAVGSVLAGLRAFAVGAAIFAAGILLVGKASLDAQIELQRLGQSYSAVFGRGANAQLEAVYQQTRAVGLEFTATAEAAKSFFAAGHGTTLAPDLNTIFNAVTNAGAALQLSTEQVNGTFIALGQMISKGKVQAEELRGQLGERLPGAFQAAAKAMGMTTAELDKFMADGKLTAEDLLPKLAQVLEEKYGEAAKRAADTAQGAINRMSTEWTLFKANVLDSGPMLYAINAVTNALEARNKVSREVTEQTRLDTRLKERGFAPKPQVTQDEDGTTTVVYGYTEQQRDIVRIEERQQAYLDQWEEQEAARSEKDSANYRAAVDKALKNSTAKKKADIEAERAAFRAESDRQIRSAKSDGKDASWLYDERTSVEAEFSKKLADLDKKGASAAKAAAVAQADYTGEVERTRAQIDSLQQQLGLDKSENLARAKIRIEEEYQKSLSKTSEELEKQVARGSLTRSQADALQAEKATAAELQKRLSLRDAETKAQEKSVRLAEGQLAFYKEYSHLSGQYENQLELQARLIDEQAQKYETLQIPRDLIEDWKRLRLLQESFDPVDGAYRGLMRFSAEYGNQAKQWDNLTYSWASNFESASKSTFDSFLDTGKLSFDSLFVSWKSLLKSMAYQALVQPIVLTVVNGTASALYGSTSVGGASGGGAGSILSQASSLGSLLVPSSVKDSISGSLGLSSVLGYQLPGTSYGSLGVMGPTATGGNIAGGMSLGSMFGAGALAGVGYSMLGPSLGLPTNAYTPYTSMAGGALGAWGGAALGTSLATTMGIAGSVVPGIGTAVGALAGAIIGGLGGSLLGGGGSEPGLWVDSTTILSGDVAGSQMEAWAQPNKGRSGFADANGQGYYVEARARNGAPQSSAASAVQYLGQLSAQAINLSTSVKDQLSAIDSSFGSEYYNAIRRNPGVRVIGNGEGDDTPDVEALGKSLISQTYARITDAVRTVDMSNIARGADGLISDTMGEMTTSITKAISIINIGSSLGDYQEQYLAAVSGKVLAALNSIDTSGLGLTVDRSSVAGWQTAYTAIQTWESVQDSLEAVLHPASELSSAMESARSQFDGWLNSLRALGWQESAIAKIESQRAEYLEKYRAALSNETRQDLAGRYTALTGTSEQLTALKNQIDKQNQLADIAKKFGTGQDWSVTIEDKLAKLNAAAYQGRTNWDTAALMEAIKAGGMTGIADWYAKYGTTEGVKAPGVSGPDWTVTIQDKLAKLNTSAYQGRTNWTQDQLLQAITDAGYADISDWYNRAGGAEGVKAPGASVYDYTSALIDAEQTKATLDALKSQQKELLQQQLSAANELTSAWDNVVKALTTTRVSIRTSDTGENLFTRQASAQAEFNRLYASAMGGDEDAAQQMQSMAAELLSLNKQTAANGDAYRDSFYDVDKKLSDVAEFANTQASAAKTQAALLNAQLSATESQTTTLAAQIATVTASITTMTNTLSAQLAALKNIGSVSADGSGSIVTPAGIYGSKYATEADLIAAKVSQLNSSGERGHTDWDASTLYRVIANEGMTVQQWYSKYGHVEGFASGGIADGLSVIGNELVHFGMSSRVYPADTTFAMAEGGFEYARDAYEGMRKLSQTLYALPAASDGSARANAALLREELTAMRQDNARALANLEKIAGNTLAAKNTLEEQLLVGMRVRS